MIVVTVVEKHKGRVVATTYKFNNENEYKKFVQLCKEDRCILIEHKKQKSKERILNVV